MTGPERASARGATFPTEQAGDGSAAAGSKRDGDAVLVDDVPDFDDLDLGALERRRWTVKWRRHGPGTIAAWVADMDLPIAPTIRRALVAAADEGDLGYSSPEAGDDLAVLYSEWSEQRHGWRSDPAGGMAVPDVVFGIVSVIATLTEPGSGVLTLTPAYPPFFDVAEASGRHLVAVPMLDDPVGWRIDFDAVRAAFEAGARTLLLCNPHNPTGRVFRPEELRSLASIAVDFEALILADEIHGDLVLPGTSHTPMASLGPDVAARTVTFVSASKAFNIAGLGCALVFAGDPDTAQRLRGLPIHQRGFPSTLGLVAADAAFTSGGPWLEAAVAHLGRQRSRLAQLLADHLPEVRCHPLEGTYLAWLDFRGCPSEVAADPAAWFLQHAGVALSYGRDFGPDGTGWARLNTATSGPILAETVRRMRRALDVQ